MNETDKAQLEARRKYVRAFNTTMVKIWREQINPDIMRRAVTI